MQSGSIGIDVAKAHLDAVLLRQDGSEGYQRVSNSETGYQALGEWLQQEQGEDLPVCLEATGRYGDGIATYLHEHRYRVSIVNPASVKHFAAALMKRHKTDKSDAAVLARYATHMQPKRWQPPPELKSQMQDLKRLLDDLQADRTRVKNRLEGLRTSSPARRYLEEQLSQLEDQLEQAQAELNQRVDQDEQPASQCRLLESIKGIGRISAMQLLAELPDLSRFDSADELVAYAGLCPHQQQSGNQASVSWLSKQGSARIRKALYFPALSAKTHNPHLRCFAERLTAAGKAKMVVVAAVMRKLLVLVYAILKSGRPYDPTFVFAA
jgi:transposase